MYVVGSHDVYTGECVGVWVLPSRSSVIMLESVAAVKANSRSILSFVIWNKESFRNLDARWESKVKSKV